MTMHKLSVLLLALGALCGEQTFEVADIHPSPPSPWNDWWRSQLKGRYEIHNATVLDLITIAYGVESETVFGGPTQLTTDRFEVTAKIPPKATTN